MLDVNQPLEIKKFQFGWSSSQTGLWLCHTTQFRLQVPEGVLKPIPSVPVLFSTIGMCCDRIQGPNRNSRVWIVIVQISNSCWIIEWKNIFSLFRRSDWRQGYRNIWHSRRREQTAKTNSRSFYSWSSQEKQEPLPTSGKASFAMHFVILVWISKNCRSSVKQSHLRDIPPTRAKKNNTCSIPVHPLGCAVHALWCAPQPQVCTQMSIQFVYAPYVCWKMVAYQTAADFRVATAQGKQGIWFLLFPDRENIGNFAVTQGKI